MKILPFTIEIDMMVDEGPTVHHGNRHGDERTLRRHHRNGDDGNAVVPVCQPCNGKTDDGVKQRKEKACMRAGGFS